MRELTSEACHGRRWQVLVGERVGARSSMLANHTVVMRRKHERVGPDAIYELRLCFSFSSGGPSDHVSYATHDNIKLLELISIPRTRAGPKGSAEPNMWNKQMPRCLSAGTMMRVNSRDVPPSIVGYLTCLEV